MRVIVTVIYVVMAGWLLIAAAVRVALLLGTGLPLDPLPFISGAIAIIGIAALPAANAELRQRHDHARSAATATTNDTPRDR